MSLGLTTGASATDAAIQNPIFGLGRSKNKEMIILNKEIEDIMKIIKSFEESVCC